MNKEKKDRPSIEAPQAVKHPDKHPPCYRSETRNPYPLCLGWGMKACAHCCLWTDYDSDEDESRVNLPLSLAQLQEMDGHSRLVGVRTRIQLLGYYCRGQ